MKRIAAICICMILLFSSTSVYLGAGNDMTQEIDHSERSAPGITPLSPGPGPQPGVQVYYTDRAVFDLDTGPLPFFEDFEEARFPPIGPGVVNGTLDQYTNDGYFFPGDIEPGIRFQDNPGPDPNGYVVIGAGQFGSPSKRVSTNTFLDSWDITFFNNDVWAVGMDIFTYIGEGTVDINIYGVGGVLLDTTTAQGTNAGTFWGVNSDELITRINLYEQTGAMVEGGDNIAFGLSLPTINRIDVTPDPATVVVGSTQLFTATAYDQFNNTIPGVDFIWSSDVGSIDATGLFTAQTTPGIGYVNATNSTVTGTANVMVVAGPLDHIIVTPNPISIPVGGTQQFNATAYDPYNNILSYVGFVWTTDVGSINATGFFTAQTTPGTGNVTATNGTVSDSATVNVILGPTVDVNSPDGGESLMGGGSWLISWSISAGTLPLKSNPITIEYSTNGSGGPWSQIAVNEVNDGIYIWNPVPSLNEPDCYIRITVEDIQGYTGEDSSNSSFEIDSIAPLPASNPYADLAGNHVTIFWGISLSSDVNHYEIWRIQNNFEPTGDSYDYIDSTNSTNYTDINVGVINPNAYFWQVRTVDHAGHVTKTILQAGKESSTLSVFANPSGWFLQGYYLNLTNTTVEYVLQSIISVADHVMLYRNGEWLHWASYWPSSMNTLTDIYQGEGLWVHITANGRWCVAGQVSDVAIPLKAGWNLVAYPSPLEDTVENALGGTGADKVEAFDPAEPYRIREVGPTYVMRPGDGYWVHVPTDTVWTVDW